MEEKSEVEGRVLGAARKLFVEQGIARTPLRAVAAEANTSESGVLRFFRDKQDLAEAVMDLCWGEVNDHVAEILESNGGGNIEPSSCLIEVVRGILEHAASDKQSAWFLVGHFNYSLSGRPNSSTPVERQRRLGPYRRYRATIGQLCERVVASDPGLSGNGITPAGLCHLVLSLIYGTVGGWYLSEQDPAVHGPALPIEDAIAMLRKVIYTDAGKVVAQA